VDEKDKKTMKTHLLPRGRGSPGENQSVALKEKKSSQSAPPPGGTTTNQWSDPYIWHLMGSHITSPQGIVEELSRNLKFDSRPPPLVFSRLLVKPPSKVFFIISCFWIFEMGSRHLPFLIF